uniref:Uncharacterized protein n=1 Tax=Pipistrellus kuhlii TaxID=59472 RepID=A0A7J7V622_PIPKU|nr:hypothetical protein mPipKuh1_008583 [Pipistrellus kuhlii]
MVSVSSRFPPSDLWAAPQTPPWAPFRSIEMGCRRDRYPGKPVASGKDDRGASGPATVSALLSGPPPLYGISQALTCCDPGQFPSPLSSLCHRPALTQSSGELVLRRNNDQNKKDFCTRQLLVT